MEIHNTTSSSNNRSKNEGTPALKLPQKWLLSACCSRKKYPLVPLKKNEIYEIVGYSFFLEISTK